MVILLIITVNLNKMKNKNISNTIMLILILFNSIYIFSQTTKSFLVKQENISLLSINGVSIMDLNEPGNNFQKLYKLGKPTNINITESFVEKIWVYEYSGIKLVYSNINGYPELLEMNVTILNSKYEISFDGKKINEKTKLNEIRSSNLKENYKGLSGRLLNSNTTENIKFEDKTSFMELILSDDSMKIIGINLKNKII